MWVFLRFCQTGKAGSSLYPVSSGSKEYKHSKEGWGGGGGTVHSNESTKMDTGIAEHSVKTLFGRVLYNQADTQSHT